VSQPARQSEISRILFAVRFPGSQHAGPKLRWWIALLMLLASISPGILLFCCFRSPFRRPSPVTADESPGEREYGSACPAVSGSLVALRTDALVLFRKRYSTSS